MQVNRRLYRCRHDRRIAGVASGVAEYFDLDPSLVRVLWLVSIFFGAVTLVLYIGMWLIVPLEPMTEAELSAAGAGPAGSAAGHHHRTTGESRWSLWFGLILVLCGALALIDVALPGWSASRYFWPLLLVGAGGILVAMAVRRSPGEPTAPSAPMGPSSPTPPAAPAGPSAESSAS
jgi:phage shock protein C